ncbi:hypothetical protein [Salinisphaera aquimarina]|uniref:OmpA-like domain-containing protein n=1 Tax=Salinisphaera aquimarina TaxID=2094031 RepID=A0ABV7EPR2_9GAMM
MNRTRAGAFAVTVLLAGFALPALAAVEREDIIMLAADGRHFTSYKTLRSDLSARVLYLGPDEAPDDALFIVPSDYQSTALDNGGTQLRFDSGSYAIMSTGRFDDEISRADNGERIFSSWNGVTRSDGHLGKWNSPDDFASFAYSWVVPDNIDIVSYRANRSGKWQQRGNTLSWRGEQVNDIAFTIRYRVNDVAGAAAPSQPKKTAPAAPSAELPLPKRQRMTTPGTALKTEPPTPIATAPTTASPAADVDENLGPEPHSVSLDSVVILANGRPRITARGHNVLDRLAAALAQGEAENITVTGPPIADSRDTGGSAAQAARVADYLGTHGVDGDKIGIRPGNVEGKRDGRSVEIRVTPGNALRGFSPGG